MEKELKVLLRLCATFGMHINVESNNSANLGLNSCSQSIQRKVIATNILELLQYIYVWSTILVIVALWIAGIVRREFEAGLMLTWLVATIVFTSQMTAHLCILFEALFKRRQHNKFLTKLYELEVTLKLCLKQDIAVVNLASKLRRKFVLLWSFSLIFLISFISAIVVTDDIGYFWPASFGIIVVRMRLMQLLIYIDILLAYLRCLNIKLRQVVACQVAQQAQMLDINYARLKSTEFLLAIKAAYGQIFETFLLFNDMAGWSLVSIVGCYVFDFTCHVYWSLLALDSILPSYNYIGDFTTLLPLAVFTCLFCVGSNACKLQSELTARLLHKLLVRGNTGEIRRYQSVIQQFSLQLCQQRIVVSAKNFFNFDVQLIMTICAAISTYIVILIQFLKSDGSK